MFIIKDSADNIMFDGREFETFDDAWGFILENIDEGDNAYDDVFVETV